MGTQRLRNVYARTSTLPVNTESAPFYFTFTPHVSANPYSSAATALIHDSATVIFIASNQMPKNLNVLKCMHWRFPRER